MSFTKKNLQSHKSGMTFLKGATFFFLGISCVLFMAKAFEVIPSMTNTMMYIKNIILTTDGSNTSSSTRITLDGSLGNGNFSGAVSATTVSANTISGTIVHGTTGSFSWVCISWVCRNDWPSWGIATIPGWLTNAIQFNDGTSFSGTNGLIRDNTKLNIKGNIVLDSSFMFNDSGSPDKSIYPISSDDIDGYNLNISAWSTHSNGGWPFTWGHLLLKWGSNMAHNSLPERWWNVTIQWWDTEQSASTQSDSTKNWWNIFIEWGKWWNGWNIYLNWWVWWIWWWWVGNIILGDLIGKVGIGTGIGTNTPSAKLTVNGWIRSKLRNTDPCSTTVDYPAWTMFYVPEHEYHYFCTNLSGTIGCQPIIMPDMYCMCNSKNQAVPINGRYIAVGNSNNFATTCFNLPL